LLELPIIPLNNYPKEISDMATAALETQPGQGLNGPDQQLMQKQSGIWNTLMDRYFRLDFEGFEKLPDEPCLLIGVHSGGPLTMDAWTAWTVIMAWWREFGDSRALHGTAHDVLMNAPVIGEYFRRLGVLSPSKENIRAAFDKGDDVILWPGGEVDCYRNWLDRDKAVLGTGHECRCADCPGCHRGRSRYPVRPVRGSRPGESTET
jgi:hypothetical protein